ncbi:MAG: tRNA (adenosine(37)-N6)-dimethylallyltransferase MiaA [Desulfovibrio sp.]|jgi:tRNA dimethylallyltransferase|nr:tRNA (adenosine(37)-N6)-dimethylallyltransferase MiaA [Desulfovibrio sp.]
MANSKPLPVVCLAGPTGTGKTAMALALAEALGGEVINADSRQVYADFPVITAQPTDAQRARCPHHCYAFLPAARKTSAGRWAEAACHAARAALARGKTPLLVGGTGLYFQALLRGMAEIPAADPAVGAELAARLAGGGLPALRGELVRVDAAYAARVHPNDRQRILRALEVFYATKHPFSWWHANARTKALCRGPLITLEADLDALTPRLARRIERMIADGAFEEVRRALAACPDTDAPGWSCIGAAEALACLQGKISRGECARLWLKNTRAYAKRQLTWFRARAEARFVAPGDTAAALALARGRDFQGDFTSP